LDAVAHHIIKLIERGLKAGGYGVSREGGSLSGEMIDPTEDEILIPAEAGVTRR
jgi:hypothetical protein